MSETRTVFDPFKLKTVEVSNRLVDRLRGKYASGPHLPNGNPEFGWRQFEAPPIQHEAAAELDRLNSRVEELEKALKPFARHLDAIEREGRWSDEQWAPMDVFDGHKSISHVAIGDLRFARSTLEASDRNGGQK